jgi:uncharacterized membrane protein YbhN (UPF0104 family)
VQEPPAVRAVRAPLPIAVAAAAAFALAAMWVLHDRAEAVAVELSQAPWLAVTVALALPLLATIHYVCAALALRGLSDRRLALRQTMLVQLAAAATNRIVPNGIGGAGVNIRYLLRAGMPSGGATSALAALAVVGGVTDAAFAAAITTLGPALGVTGASRELHALAASGMSASHKHSLVLIVAVPLIVAVVLWRRRGKVVSGVASGVRHAIAHARELVCQPRRLTTAAAASMATTAAMTISFVLAVSVWGHASTPLPAGALAAIYLVAAAAGGATPLPAVFGVTEAAMIGALVVGGYTSTSAIAVVIIFRVVTYWLPLPVGIWAARRLRHANLL